MRRDRAAFAFGVLAVAFAALALWTVYGVVDRKLVGILVPAAMVVAGVGVLLLSRRHN
ncbi:MAG: hypothetical protein QM779_17585 [Propionicimonas sp.]|uniref:hypothetical protein n=1 Tax=Propionicimonas sp. TaxID=1955623 RepID=UPI003D1415C3